MMLFLSARELRKSNSFFNFSHSLQITLPGCDPDCEIKVGLAHVECVPVRVVREREALRCCLKSRAGQISSETTKRTDTLW